MQWSPSVHGVEFHDPCRCWKLDRSEACAHLVCSYLDTATVNFDFIFNLEDSFSIPLWDNQLGSLTIFDL